MGHCIFCDIIARKAPAWIVFEDASVIAFFTISPVAEYHTLVVPKGHASDIHDVLAQDWVAMNEATHRIVAAYKAQLGIEDVQIITSNGAAAQQDVFHIHQHIVPRTAGDGQDVVWNEDPSIRERFDDLIAALGDPI